jgi:hypothetical protein
LYFYVFTCLKQLLDSIRNCILLGLIFSNFSNVRTSFVDAGVVRSDAYHPSVVAEIHFSFHNSTENHEFSYRKVVSREYGPLYTFVFSYERTCMYNSTTAYAAVCSLTNATHGSVDLVIQSGIIGNSKFSP